MNNWYFGDPVNQLSSKSYITTTNNSIITVIDFYYMSLYNTTSTAKGSLTINDGYTTLSITSSDGYLSIYDYEENDLEIYNSDYLIFSIVYRMSEGKGNITFYSEKNTNSYHYLNGIYLEPSQDFRVQSFILNRNLLKNGRTRNIRISVYGEPNKTISLDILAIKLEKGQKQTLAQVDKNGKIYLLDKPNKVAERYNAMRKHEYIYFPSAATIGASISYKVPKDKNPAVLAYDKNFNLVASGVSSTGTVSCTIGKSNVFSIDVNARD